ncbi:MAG: DUF5655 domain-containing protein [Spirochaetaceae bacterium]|jgi:uncharacterized protein YdhG (YjbR/CyaY superfamily)|nr:DUF5655 domain-containing protein [Spirochaetaceae bacterium]
MPSNVFSGVRAPWLPLYEELREMARKTLDVFEEHETASAIVWRKNSAFAEIGAKRAGLVIAFAREAVSDEMNPVKVVQTSKNRVVHSYAATDNMHFPWFIEKIRDAYTLTGQQEPAAKKPRTHDTPRSVDEYIALFPGDVQAILQKIRQTIRAAAPHAEEKIAWQMPTFSQNGNLIHFAAAKTHIGIYPGPETITHFADRLRDYPRSKGTVQFPFVRPIPYDLIADMTAWIANRDARCANG